MVRTIDDALDIFLARVKPNNGEALVPIRVRTSAHDATDNFVFEARPVSHANYTDIYVAGTDEVEATTSIPNVLLTLDSGERDRFAKEWQTYKERRAPQAAHFSRAVADYNSGRAKRVEQYFESPGDVEPARIIPPHMPSLALSTTGGFELKGLARILVKHDGHIVRALDINSPNIAEASDSKVNLYHFVCQRKEQGYLNEAASSCFNTEDKFVVASSMDAAKRKLLSNTTTYLETQVKIPGYTLILQPVSKR